MELLGVCLTMNYRAAARRFAPMWMRVQRARPLAAQSRKVASAYNRRRSPRAQEEFSKPCDSKTLGRGFADSTIALFMLVACSVRAIGARITGTKKVPRPLPSCAARQGKR